MYRMPAVNAKSALRIHSQRATRIIPRIVTTLLFFIGPHISQRLTPWPTTSPGGDHITALLILRSLYEDNGPFSVIDLIPALMHGDPGPHKSRSDHTRQLLLYAAREKSSSIHESVHASIRKMADTWLQLPRITRSRIDKQDDIVGIKIIDCRHVGINEVRHTSGEYVTNSCAGFRSPSLASPYIMTWVGTSNWNS
ncbi:hypothetical protein BJV77DRAFT_666810 [Russula vinacea]|nr:hypothetical protein BJV77DRAFT_666810 [Russula vinacea]